MIPKFFKYKILLTALMVIDILLYMLLYVITEALLGSKFLTLCFTNL